MELEREPQQKKTGPHARPLNKPLYQDHSMTTAKFERVSYAREVCYGLGAIFITLGLVGFVVDNLLMAHLSYAHNIIHVLSGLAAVTCAYNSRRSAQNFAWSFGALYGALGILGFILGVSAEASVGPMGRDASLWVLSPGVLEFGTSDHIIHLVFAAIFIGSALIHRQRRTSDNIVYH